MADVDLPCAVTRPRKSSRLVRLAAAPAFQRWASRVPLLRRIVRNEGEALFDLVAGFCHSQILQALVKFDIPGMLLEAELPARAIAARCQAPVERIAVLLQAAQSLHLLRRTRDGSYALTVRGAALAGVPGLSGMIAHHDVLYRDLADPVAFFRGETDPELAAFWPYVFGAGAVEDPNTAATYSALMADSQSLVAADTLATIRLSGVKHLMDVGGGTGAFLEAVGAAYPALQMTLFDLPAVAPHAANRFAAADLADRTTIQSGSFRDDPLPTGADAISLVRVLYDHTDDTVRRLLTAAYTALPPGGRIIISEPMTGGERPERAGDAYFALYCMAMQTGTARSQDQIAALLGKTGFQNVLTPRAKRPFITSVVTGVKPA
ncbi:demethylspheroidene O-methyltransferase [Cognatiyoonia koreensis]|uniref:Demethylspheroidene O-methyltransferase n=1 Tax=Cognatiyoonia koreensis TaxID=364200 RepID=A0A1I0RKT7_9RHOB|nr:methyltransferase [Cognatiyoonia koreensis]SEW41598.1 demethylspheroidene O-methyltransferase [Cognatiyoonia koreensis]